MSIASISRPFATSTALFHQKAKRKEEAEMAGAHKKRLSSLTSGTFHSAQSSYTLVQMISARAATPNQRRLEMLVGDLLAVCFALSLFLSWREKHG